MNEDTRIFSLSRLEAITDGIFAIIITIIILTITVPNGNDIHSSKDLSNALLETIPLVINYAISFFLISTFWLAHIQELKMLKGTNRTHIILNFLYIFFVSLVPFTTSLIGDYSDYIIAECIFHVNILLIYIASIIHWYYAVHVADLKLDSISEKIVKREEAIQKIKLIFPLVGFSLAFVIPGYSTLTYAFLHMGITLVKKKYNK